MIKAIKNISMVDFGLMQPQLISLEKLGILNTEQLANYLNELNPRKIDFGILQERLELLGNSKPHNARTIIVLVKTLVVVNILKIGEYLQYYYVTATIYKADGMTEGFCGVEKSTKGYFDIVGSCKKIAKTYNTSYKNVAIKNFIEISKDMYNEYRAFVKSKDT